MQFKNLLLAALTFVPAFMASSLLAQVPQQHDPLIVFLSPSISQSDRADFYNSLEHLCMERLSPGDRVVIYDGTNLKLVANFVMPANAKSPRVKVKDLSPLWTGVAGFLKPADDKKIVEVPQFLNSVMQVFPGSKPDILIVGSPVYCDSAHKYDMSKGWLSDAYLNAAPSDSIFSVSGKNHLLNGAKVYYCYLSDDFFDPTNDKEAHKAKIQSFWGKYIEGMGGKLVTFLPNVKDVFPQWGQGVDGAVQHEPIDSTDKNMTIVMPSPPHIATIFDRGSVSIPSDLLFSSGSAELKPAASSALQDLAKNMSLDKSLRFRIDGYTDSHGSADLNQKLSLKRADSVKSWLVQNGAIDPSRIVTVGCGKSNPKVPVGSSAEEAPNRRVEITSIK